MKSQFAAFPDFFFLRVEVKIMKSRFAAFPDCFSPGRGQNHQKSICDFFYPGLSKIHEKSICGLSHGRFADLFDGGQKDTIR